MLRDAVTASMEHCLTTWTLNKCTSRHMEVVQPFLIKAAVPGVTSLFSRGNDEKNSIILSNAGSSFLTTFTFGHCINPPQKVHFQSNCLHTHLEPLGVVFKESGCY